MGNGPHSSDLDDPTFLVVKSGAFNVRNSRLSNLGAVTAPNNSILGGFCFHSSFKNQVMRIAHIVQVFR